MDNIISIFLISFCVTIPFVLFAFWGIRSRRKYADNLKRKIADGHFDNAYSHVGLDKVIASIEFLLLLIAAYILILFFRTSSQEVKIASFIVFGGLVPVIIFLGALMLKGLR